MSKRRPVTRDRLHRIYRAADSPYQREGYSDTDGAIRWIADRVDVHRTTVSRWLSDTQQPGHWSHWKLWKLEYELGVVRERMESAWEEYSE